MHQCMVFDKLETHNRQQDQTTVSLNHCTFYRLIKKARNTFLIFWEATHNIANLILPSMFVENLPFVDNN